MDTLTQNSTTTVAHDNTQGNMATPAQDSPTIASTADTQVTNHCAICDKPAAFRCGRCCEGVDIHGSLSTTHYCGKACQASHWTTHKTECKSSNARKQLYRAGNVARDLFYAARRANWRIKLEHVEVREDMKVHAHQVELGESDALLYKFPEGVLEDEKSENALLVHDAGFEAVAMMSRVVESMLEGVVSKYEEVSVSVKTPNRVTVHRSEGASTAKDQPHWVLRVALKDSSVFALDLAAAQYGYNTVMPWSDYNTTFMKDLVDISTFHTACNMRHMDQLAMFWCAGTEGAPNRESRLCFITYGANQALAEGMNLCSSEDGISPSALVTLPRSKFEVQSAQRLDKTRSVLNRCAQIGASKNRFTEYLGTLMGTYFGYVSDMFAGH